MRLKNDRFPVFAVVVVEADAGGAGCDAVSLDRSTPCSSTPLALLFHLDSRLEDVLLVLPFLSLLLTGCSAAPSIFDGDVDEAPLDDFLDLRPGKRMFDVAESRSHE